MTKFISTAAIFAAATSMLAALAVPSAANAQDVSNVSTGNHYEWRASPQYGPRMPLRAPVRVLVDANGKPVTQKQPVVALAMNDGSGHYEWRALPNYGPRAPLRAPVRTWVPSTEMAAMVAERAQN